MEKCCYRIASYNRSVFLLSFLLLISNLLHSETLLPYEDLTTWTTINGIVVNDLQNDAYQLQHPGNNWPILIKSLPVIPADATLRVSFHGWSSPGTGSLRIVPWGLATTGGGHISLSDTEQPYERNYVNNTGTAINDADLRFYFADSQSSGFGQEIYVSQFRYELITVDGNQPPIASMTATPIGGEVPLTVNVDGSGSSDSDGSVVDYAWDFGDGTTATGINASHNYTTAGDYTITLTVTDNEGSSSSDNIAISVFSNSTPTDITTTAVPGAAEASRFLTQSTFGSTLSDIDALLVLNLDYNAWIDQQVAIPMTSHLLNSQGPNPPDRVKTWWDESVNAPDQLRQRMAWALSQIFVISDRAIFFDNGSEATYGYYDLLLENAFGNFRDLMESVSKNLAMGLYLSLKNSQKTDLVTGAHPDENYARELMQLFTIGLLQLNQDGSVKMLNGESIPTYTQQDVEELSRALTGWSSEGQWRWWWDHSNPMVAYPDYHDDGEKVFLGQTIPAGQTPEQDMEDVLDILFNHPNVGPFISKQLIQRFVTSNPSPGYISRVASVFDDNGSGTRGDLLAVLRAILMDTEARTLHPASEGFGKLREPLLKQTHLWRAFRIANGIYSYAKPEDDFLQAPLRSPSVFNFYYPNFSPSGELHALGKVAPEFQIVTDSTVTTSANRFFYTAIGGRWNTYVELDVNVPLSLVNSPGNLLDYLDLILTYGTMSAELRASLVTHLAENESLSDEVKVRELIYLIVSSPEYAVQQ